MLFEVLLEKIKTDLIKFILNLNIVISEDKNDGINNEVQKTLKPETSKIGRNDKCPCKSGKKYKHCCGSI